MAKIFIIKPYKFNRDEKDRTNFDSLIFIAVEY